LLGAIQGITEWFPVSSSGHLVIAQQLLGLGNLVIYDIVLHLGSVISIIIVLWKDIVAILKGLVHGDQETWVFVIKLAIASVPVGIFGILFDNVVESTFSQVWVVGIGWLITGTFLFMSRWPREKKQEFTYKRAMIVGLFEAISIFPGVSRSGSTTVGGLVQGIKHVEAGRFAFLLSIPAILGAFIFKIGAITLVTVEDLLPITISLIVTILLSVITLRLTMRILLAKKYDLFAFYCWIAGIVVLILYFAIGF